MAGRARKLGLVATPLLAMATLAVGLRLGQTEQVHAAFVYGALPKPGTGRLAWRVITMAIEYGRMRPVPLADVKVVATSGEKVATWTGASTVGGLAEVLLELPALASGDPVHLDVTAGKNELARGDVAWEEAPRQETPAQPWNAYARREGEIALDVVVYGERLTVGFVVPVWARATERGTGKPLGGVEIGVEPTIGLRVGARKVVTDERGWAVIAATAVDHTSAIALHSELPGDRGLRGEWASALPVSKGSDQVVVPERIAPGEARPFDLFVDSERHTTYVDVLAAPAGRVAGAVVELRKDAGGMGRGSFVMPPLDPGLYWLVTSAEQGGAQRLEGATLARPFFVAATDEAALAFGAWPRECAVPLDPKAVRRALGACLALTPAPSWFEWLALDGTTPIVDRDNAKRARGAKIAVGAMIVAAALEILLILRTVSESRRTLRIAQGNAPELANVGQRYDAVTIAAGLLFALLGFAFVAALVIRTS